MSLAGVHVAVPYEPFQLKPARLNHGRLPAQGLSPSSH